MRRDSDDNDNDDSARRQFASWHRDGRALIGFGGYNTRRLASIAVIDVHRGCAVRDFGGGGDCGVVPPAVLHHRTVLRRRSLVVIGGRTRPAAPSAGLYVLDLDAWRWRMSPTCVAPAPRYRFALAHDPGGDRAFVSSGIGAGPHLLADLWVLDLRDYSWQRLPGGNGGAGPGPRHSHSLSYSAGRLYLLGGLTGLGSARPTDPALYCYDLGRSRWSRVDVRGDIPPPIYSHVAVVVHGDADIVVVGGVANASGWAANLFLFETRSRTWIRAVPDVTRRLGRERILIGHDVVGGSAPGKIGIVGGGATCFSFGRWMNGPPVELDLAVAFPGAIAGT